MIRTSSETRVAGVCALVLALEGLALPLAHAEPSAVDVTTAKSLVVEARALRAKGKHAPARDRFKGAWALVPTPIIGMDLAREHVALGELVEGREVAIAVTKLPDIPKESDESRTARADAAKLANELAARIPSIIITVTPLPAGAAVTVDGAAVPTATLGVPRKLNPGKHEIVVRVGEKDATRTVTLAEGQERSVTIDGMELGAASDAPSVGSSSPSTSGGATSPEGGRPTWAWIALGVGGVGAVVGAAGTVTAFSGSKKTSDAPARTDPLWEEGKRENTTGIALAVVGGAVLVGGLVVFAIAPTGSKRSTTATAVTGLAISPSGFTLIGRF